MDHTHTANKNPCLRVQLVFKVDAPRRDLCSGEVSYLIHIYFLRYKLLSIMNFGVPDIQIDTDKKLGI